MKFTKLSLIAALAVTSAMAGDAKITGDARVYYSTDDMGTHGLFNKDGAYGDAAVNLNYSKDLSDMVTISAGVTGISTLGLENTLVSGTWAPHGGARSAMGVNDKVWIDTANVTLKPIDKTMVIAGRLKLKGGFSTPLAFTETWNIAENSFDAAVLVDQHIDKTMLIGAWVGRGNGHNGFENIDGGMGKYGALSAGQNSALSGLNGSPTSYMNRGAYAAAAITTLIPNTTAQLWYYDVVGQANAIWAQADVAPTKEFSVGLQYATIMPKGAVEQALPTNSDDTKAMAFKLGYDAGSFNVFGAYSKLDDTGLVYMGNTATGGAHGGQSKLYTEAWWNYGFVGQAGAKTMAIGGGYDMSGTALTLQATDVKNDNSNMMEMTEITATASTKVGPFDATVALINSKSDNAFYDGNTVQVYLTAPFSL